MRTVDTVNTVQLALDMQQAIISEFSGSAGASKDSVRIPTDGKLSIHDVYENIMFFQFNENTYEYTTNQCKVEKTYDYPTTMSLADELSDIIQNWLDSAVAV